MGMRFAVPVAYVDPKKKMVLGWVVARTMILIECKRHIVTRCNDSPRPNQRYMKTELETMWRQNQEV